MRELRQKAPNDNKSEILCELVAGLQLVASQ